MVCQVGEARIVCLDSEWESIDESSAGESRQPGRRSEPGLRDLHLGLDGQAQRGADHARRARELAAGDAAGCLPIDAQDTLLAVTTLSFDIAALEIFLPLIVGARVELIDRDVAADGARLAAFARTIPGSRSSRRRPPRGDCCWKRAGREIRRSRCSAAARRSPALGGSAARTREPALWNVYGPTETTIWSSACRVEGGETPISIGRPIANTQFYVLDNRLRRCPSGVIGELYIGGAGLALAAIGSEPR